MVTPIRSILKSAARAWGLEPAARLAAARSAWPRIAGPALAASSAPVGVRGKTLLIGVTNGTAAQEVRLVRTTITHALARELGEAGTDIVPVTRRRLDLRVPRSVQRRRVQASRSGRPKPARG